MEKLPLHDPMSADTDKRLIEAFLGNQRDAHNQLSKWIQDVIRAKLWVGTIEPKDIVQDTIIGLLEAFRAGRFRFESSLKTYVQVIARNVLADYAKYDIRLRNYISKQDPNPTDGRNPLGDLIDKERLKRSMRVLRLVSEECRGMYSMILKDELSHREIAGILGISEGASKVRWSRCVSRMKEIAAKLQ